jgi:hypothetical protein
MKKIKKFFDVSSVDWQELTPLFIWTFMQFITFAILLIIHFNK